MELQKVAETLKKVLSENGFAGRLGGDEIMFMYAEQNDMINLQKLLSQVFLYLHTCDHKVTIPIHASIGIAVAPWDGSSFNILYQKADIALYNKKNGRKNGWQIYKESMN